MTRGATPTSRWLVAEPLCTRAPATRIQPRPSTLSLRRAHCGTGGKGVSRRQPSAKRAAAPQAPSLRPLRRARRWGE
eukprot:8973838-Lingulodinium_polyedra.AAC.1